MEWAAADGSYSAPACKMSDSARNAKASNQADQVRFWLAASVASGMAIMFAQPEEGGAGRISANTASNLAEQWCLKHYPTGRDQLSDNCPPKQTAKAFCQCTSIEKSFGR